LTLFLLLLVIYSNTYGMKKILPFLLVFAFSKTFSQDLPIGMTAEEQAKMADYIQSWENHQAKGIVTPPPFSKIRNMAEWEEIQTLTITWTSYTSILRDIVKYAQTETKVTIVCSDSTTVKNYLTAGSVPLTNLRFVIAPFNSVWIRDYGQNTCYVNDVDSLFLVDWIYNRPTRPKDDTVPSAFAKALNIPMYETTQSPNNLIHTGGNYMSDGFGTAFSSKLTDTENPSKTAQQIDSIMYKYMGIKKYIRMNVLPFDGIHHIDMHMKLLDEQTLLMGQYPNGIADGPQIEANLQYILNNFMSVYGTPYKVIRIPQPPDKNGFYPHQGGAYCTYANAVFVNKTVILPTFYTQYDTTALRIWKQSLPGYKIIGIDCDNASANIIGAGGAIHCITHCIGVSDPLLISHKALENLCDSVNPYTVNALIKHKAGIASAKVYWTTDTTQAWQSVNMTLTNMANSTWTGFIPPQGNQKQIFYYIEANSTNGKIMKRPMPAPKGYWKFKVNCGIASGVGKDGHTVSMKSIYPNPASAITCIPLQSYQSQEIEVQLKNVLGQTVDIIFKGEVNEDEKNIFLFADRYSSGVYFIEVRTKSGSITQKLIIK